MNNYIQIYNNVIDDNYCDELREKFEKKSKQQEHIEQGPMSFSQLNLNLNSYDKSYWQDDVSKLSNVFLHYINQYKQDCDITPQMWPVERTDILEQIRIKKYLNNDKDEFGPHVDAISSESALRFLVFFIYLDDNERGETAFPQLGVASPCKKGNLLMFPPLWPWMHAGAKPVGKSKYIVGSYLHYNKDSKRFTV